MTSTPPQGQGQGQSDSAFPAELTTPVAELHARLGDLQKILEPLLKTKRSDLHESNGHLEEPLDKAKVDLANAFVINSLMWIWMKTKGENPKESEVKSELDRVKSCMSRLKEIQARANRKGIDKEAAKRFITSGLWNPGEKKLQVPEGQSQSPQGQGQSRGRGQWGQGHRGHPYNRGGSPGRRRPRGRGRGGYQH